jgi:hypothetical protein
MISSFISNVFLAIDHSPKKDNVKWKDGALGKMLHPPPPKKSNVSVKAIWAVVRRRINRKQKHLDRNSKMYVMNMLGNA